MLSHARLLQGASKLFGSVRELSEIFSRVGYASAGAYTYVAAVARILGKSFRESRNASRFHAQARQSAPLPVLNGGGRRIMSIPNL